MHASWNAIVRSATDDRLIALASMTGFAALLALPFIFVFPLPKPEVWALLALSITLHTMYKLFLIKAYSIGDLGHVYPLARGTAPLLITGLSFVILGEHISTAAFAGLMLVTAGILSLAWNGGRNGRNHRQATIWALVTAGFIAAYSTADGIGARTATISHTYIAWLFVLDGFVFTLLATYRRGFQTIFKGNAHIKAGMIGAVLQFFSYWLVVWAMTQAPLGLVSALRETSVLFATLISAVFLKERLGKTALAAAIMVTAGVALLRI